MIRLKVRDIEVGACIGDAPKFRIYHGTKEDGQSVILKVAKTFEDGRALTEEAAKFTILQSFEYSVAMLEERQGSGNSHYDWLFAKLYLSFMEPSQGNRRINVYTMPEISLDELVPLTKLCNTVEIDARTSVWILGRLFKFYGFFELLATDDGDSFVRYPVFSPDDYLIGPEKHRLIYYNFSDEMPAVMANDFVRAITRFMVEWTEFGDNSLALEYFHFLEEFLVCGCVSFEKT